MKISEYVYNERIRLNINKADYAKIIGISDVQVGKIERGFYDNPTAIQAIRFCKWFNVEPNKLSSFDFNPTNEFIDVVAKRLNGNNTDNEWELSNNEYSKIKKRILCFSKGLKEYNYSLLTKDEKSLLIDKLNVMIDSFVSLIKEV